MDIRVFAKNYRGFKEIDIELGKMTFVTGDNSSGKSSILLLLHYIFSTGLFQNPALDKDAVYDRYDFFSPYFNYEDVTIGYMVRNGKESIGRMMDLRRSDDKKTLITKATWFNGDKGIILKRENKKIRGRLLTQKTFDIETLKKIHSEKTDKDFLDLEDLGSESNEVFIRPEFATLSLLEQQDKKNISENNKKSSRRYFSPRFWGFAAYRFSRTYLPRSILTDPIRKRAARLYEAECEFDSKGGHFASRLSLIEKERRSNALKLINDFGKKSGLFDDIHATPLNSEASTSHLLVELQKHGQKFYLDQMGAGVAQVLPIIIDTASLMDTKQRKTLLLLQQPELHLHPIAQAELGSFFYKMVTEKLCYVIETHSDYLIDRFCAHLKENNNADLNAKIIFCESGEQGNTYSSIEIDKDGTLGDTPDNYRNFFIKESIRTM